MTLVTSSEKWHVCLHDDYIYIYIYIYIYCSSATDTYITDMSGSVALIPGALRAVSQTRMPDYGMLSDVGMPEYRKDSVDVLKHA